VHYCDADAGNVKLLHAREQRRAGRRLAFDDDGRRKAGLNLLYALVSFRRSRLPMKSRNRTGEQKQEYRDAPDCGEHAIPS
jgi:hypothetical protein